MIEVPIIRDYLDTLSDTWYVNRGSHSKRQSESSSLNAKKEETKLVNTLGL